MVHIYKEAKRCAVVSHHTISLSMHMNIDRDDGSELIERILVIWISLSSAANYNEMCDKT